MQGNQSDFLTPHPHTAQDPAQNRHNQSDQHIILPGGTVSISKSAECIFSTIKLLPHVTGICACPVLIEANGNKILSKGYYADRNGLLVTSGKVEDVSNTNAVNDIKQLLSDFDFTTAGDRSRAIASFITPALRMGGFIQGNIPIDISEANLSQAGKTLRRKVICAVYNEKPYIVAQRQGGVGSADESFSQALIAGRPFIQIDNARGRLDSQYLEAFITADGFIGARVPHRGEVQIDSRFFILLMTSNGIETTSDLANRASIVRIKKRPKDYAFAEYSEGSLLDHVWANQSHYLGCIFAVIKEWIEQGKQKTNETRHDFRVWAQILDWIVQNIFGEASPGN